MDVGGWLRNLDLGQYESAFLENAVDSDVLTELTEGDLEKLGIPLGDRKRLIKAIKAIKAMAGGSAGALITSEGEKAPSDLSIMGAAERRHLTVMICDLADATALSAHLDPDDIRAKMDAYHAACARITLSYDGFLADFRDDRILAYFGYPYAYEDDAVRSVRAGLDIVAAVAHLKRHVEEPLSVRIGIATGWMMVDDLRAEATLRKHSVGDPPSVAAHLQGLVEPGTAVVDASTRRLLGDRFRLRDLGRHKVKGIGEPVAAWAVDGISASGSRSEAVRAAGLTDLIGREDEIEFVLKRQRLAWNGEGQIVLISGEPGIGKSRFVAALEERLADEPHTLLRYQCSPHYTTSALYPFIAQLARAARFKASDTTEQRLDKLEALLAIASPRAAQDTAPIFAKLLSIPLGDRYPNLVLNPAQQRRRTFAALLDQFENLSRRKPILLLFEDVHWADATSLELLNLTVERIRHLPVLALFTFRPEFEPRWIGLHNVHTLTLDRLDRSSVESMVTQVAGGLAMPAQVMNQIVDKTDGNPLFVEELTKALLEGDILIKDAEGYRLDGPLPPLAIPATLQDSLMVRLDRMTAVKEISQIGAAIGRDFSYSLMRELVRGDETRLRHGLSKLEQATLVFRRGEPPEAIYSFKHALVRDAAYESLPNSRRHLLHGQIAHAIKEKFPDILVSQPELVAHHFTEAGFVEPAIEYWLKAGNLALGRSANAAIDHLKQGLKLLPKIDDPKLRNKSELLLQTSLGNSLREIEGWSTDSVKNAYTRAIQLCKESGLDEYSSPAVFGLWTWNFLHATLGEAQGLAEHLLNIAENLDHSVYRVLAHQALGFTLFGQGKFAAGHTELERSIGLCEDSEAVAYLELSAQDPRSHVRSYDAMALWFLGFPDQALRRCEEACRYADAFRHPFSQAIARTISLRVHQFRGEADVVAGQANAAIAFCEEHEFTHYLAMALILRGWARAQRGEFEKGIVEIQKGLEKEQATGAQLFESYSLALMADAYLKNGRCMEAFEFLKQAQLRLEEDSSGCFYAAEVYRLLGEACLRSNHNLDQAEHHFAKGLNVAREQKAKSLELRLCLSMCDLYELRKNADEYLSQLGEIYGSFNEGFDSPDLARAKARLGV